MGAAGLSAGMGALGALGGGNNELSLEGLNRKLSGPEEVSDINIPGMVDIPNTIGGGQVQRPGFKNGGKLWKKYGGKMYANGGSTAFTTTQQDNGLVVLNGKDHDQGGIDLKEGIEVEGGETIWNDFVFTNSHKIDKATAEKFNLPKGSVNNTFAKASKNYSKYLDEHPHDPYAKEEFNEHMARLQEAHLAAVPQSRPENIQLEAMNASFKDLDHKLKTVVVLYGMHHLYHLLMVVI